MDNEHISPLEELYEDLRSRIIQRNLNDIELRDLIIEEDLLAFAKDPTSSDDNIIVTASLYNEQCGTMLGMWKNNNAKTILQDAIEMEEEKDFLFTSNILYKMAHCKSQNYEAAEGAKRTDKLIRSRYSSNDEKIFDTYVKYVLALCQCIKNVRME
jgi:hypothetical protein